MTPIGARRMRAATPPSTRSWRDWKESLSSFAAAMDAMMYSIVRSNSFVASAVFLQIS
eukprot:CAMPEP_0171266178 /NCGR_PEP_ID=MMETSP0790-20130122/58508_1 /TAXON_ID=2925 /ORGANISM="Alexandrium catenella, Strain OF101" /LENGTH=57 /DNA_ID=CAMNT_0011734873 /DNA_START=42 /DNA_END=211 /DNA_ORIENTATION=+